MASSSGVGAGSWWRRVRAGSITLSAIAVASARAITLERSSLRASMILGSLVHGGGFASSVAASSAALASFLQLPLHAVQFMWAPFSASRKGVGLDTKTKSRSSEDLASLAAQTLFGGGKKQKERTVRVRTAL